MTDPEFCFERLLEQAETISEHASYRDLPVGKLMRAGP